MFPNYAMATSNQFSRSENAPARVKDALATSSLFVRVVFIGAMCLAMNAPASAQTAPDSLVGLLVDLNRRINIFVGLPAPTDTAGVASFGNIIALEQSTMPLGTSTGAFNFIFDPQLGTFTQSTASFGPAFSSRSLTTGRNHFSAGFNYLNVSYDSYAGMNLKKGELSFVRNVQGPPQGPRDSNVTLDLSSNTVVAFGNFGVTDNLDVGIVVPWVSVNMGGQVGLFDAAGIDLTGGSLRIPQATSTGIGDVSIVGKYRVLRQAEGGIAAMLQVHLPSGDPNNFRGVGVTRTMIAGVWSMGGRVSPHLNLGYEFWSDAIADTEVKDQVMYAMGAEVQVTPKVTAVLDLIGRRLLGAGGNYYASDMTGPFPSEVLSSTGAALNIVSLAPGIKWNAAGNGLLTANVLVSLADDGLRANFIPVIGMDWTF